MDDDHVSVILEDIQSQFRAFGEGLGAVRSDVSEMKTDLKETKETVDKNSFLIKHVLQEQQEMKKDITEIKTDIKEMKQDIKRIDKKVSVHDKKLAMV